VITDEAGEERKRKKKERFSLCSTKHRAVKTYRVVEVQMQAFLTSALEGVG
jgi:hypothetical protein